MKHILATLAFYAQFQGLHSFDRRNRQTKRAIKSLENAGFLKVHWDTFQAEHTGKDTV